MKKINHKKGAIIIYCSLLVSLFMGLLSSSLTAKYMLPLDFGGYRFLQSAMTLSATASTLGVFTTFGLICLDKNNESNVILLWRGVSAIILFFFIVAGLLFPVILIYLSSAEGLFELSTLFCMLFVGASILPLLLQEVLRAEGDSIGLFFLNSLPQIIFLCLFFAILQFNFSIDIKSISLIFFLSQAVTGLLLIHRANGFYLPSIDGFKYLWRKNINLGINIYWATLLGVITAQSGIFILQWLIGGVGVAEFSLSLVISLPLSLLPSAIGTAYFSKLEGGGRFPPKVLFTSWVLILIMAIIYYFLSPILIDVLYGTKYPSVTSLSVICALAALLQGMGDIYNRFFLANRKTKFLFQVALGVMLISVFGGAILVHWFAGIGAAWARLIASLGYVSVMLISYHFKTK